jgi:hypothetical protein
MANDFIGVDLLGLKELTAALDSLPDEIKDTVSDDVGKYVLNVFRGYPPQKSVSRRLAYGVPFFTDKQRRWFFANLNEGKLEIPYKRTQRLSKGWKKLGEGQNTIIVNEEPHADVVMGEGQSRHAAKIGWQQMDDIIEARKDRIMEIANAGIKKALRKMKLRN